MAAAVRWLKRDENLGQARPLCAKNDAVRSAARQGNDMSEITSDGDRDSRERLGILTVRREFLGVDEDGGYEVAGVIHS